MQNRNQIRIFLSSTFRDMTHERDYLLKTIFPEVRRVARERRVELTAIDLRWGVTEEEAQQGKVVRICLEEINRCKPFFIGFLGERYGWAPSLDDLDHYEDLIEQFPIVGPSIRDRKSVTEMEILHGVLEAEEEIEAVFYERSKTLTTAFANERERICDFFETEEEGQKKLKTLKKQIKESNFPVYDYSNLEELGLLVKKELLSLLDRLYPESEVPNTLEAERQSHRAYAEDRTFHYLPDYETVQKLDDYIQRPAFNEQNIRKPPLLIGGASGLGKSALLSYWLTQYRTEHPDAFVIEYFPGAQGGVRERDVLTRILREVDDRLATRHAAYSLEEEVSFPKELEDLSQHVLQKLAQVPEKDPLLIVLDAINQVEMDTLTWLPQYLPPSVTLVMSALPSEIENQLQQRGCIYLEVRPLNRESRTRLIKEFLGFYRKKLSKEQLTKIVDTPQCQSPLFLTTVLAELQIFGSFEKLDQLIENCIAQPNLPALFAFMIQRFEEDYGRDLTHEVLTYLWASRKGLSEAELMAITKRSQLEISPILFALEHHLMKKEGLLSFSHTFLQQAVQSIYLAHPMDQRELHHKMANWFDKQELNDRKVEELAWQWQHAQEWNQLKECVCDLDLFSALYTKDEYELLGYWVSLQDEFDLEKSYINVLSSLEINFEKDLYRFKEGDWHETHYDQYQYRFEAHRQNIYQITCFLKLAGQYQNLLFSCRWLYQGAQLFYGREARQTLIYQNHLADLFSNGAQYDEAERLYRELVNIEERISGTEHSNTINIVNSLGYVLELKGEYDEAEVLYRRALEVRTRRLEEEHPDFVTSLNNLGALLYSKGDCDGAEPLFRQVLKTFEKTLGKDHPDTLTSLNNLGSVLELTENYDEAESLYRQALASRQKLLGKEHPDTLTSLNNLGSFLYSHGDYDGAIDLCRQALEVFKKVLGEEHPDTLTALNNLGTFLHSKGDHKEAECSYRQALEARDRTLGKDHPDTLISLNNLGLLLQSKDQYVEAEPLLRRVLKTFQESGGMTGTHVKTFSGNLAWALVLQGKAQEAQPLFQNSLDPNHTQDQWQYYWRRLGLALCTLLITHNSDSAESHLTQLTKLLGSDHERVHMAQDRFDLVQKLDKAQR